MCCISEIPPPEGLKLHKTDGNLNVTWNKQSGLDQASSLLSVCKGGTGFENVLTTSTKYVIPAKSLEPETSYVIFVSTIVDDCQSKPVAAGIRGELKFVLNKIILYEPVYSHCCV